MINFDNSSNLQYEQINQKIKNNLKNNYLSFNESEKSIHYMPLNKKEIQKEIIKEFDPILNSLKNEYILKINDIYNEIKFFKLKRYKIKDTKNDILNESNRINLIKNKLITLKNETLLNNNILTNNLKEKTKRNINIVSKKNALIKNYEDNKNNLSTIALNQKKIEKDLEINNNKHIENKNILNNFQKNFENFSKNMPGEGALKKEEIFKSFEKQLIVISDKIYDLKNEINDIKNNINDLKLKEKEIPEIIKMQNYIKNKKKNILNEIYNNIDSINNNIQLLQENLKKNIEKLNYISKNISEPTQISTKEKEAQIEQFKEKLTTKNDIEEKNNEIKLIKQDQLDINNKEKMHETYLDKIKNDIQQLKLLFQNFTPKKDYTDYINNLNIKYNNIINSYNENINNINEKENKSNTLLKNYIQNQNNNKNNIGNEINNINQIIGNIKISIEEEKNKVNMNMQNMQKIESELTNLYDNISKINYINNNINDEKKELNELNQKLLDIEKKANNESVEKYEYRNSVMKNINNCIFENNKNMNEIIKKGLLNKEKKNNLFIKLNDIEKNMINNNKFLDDLIDNFIEKQNLINYRNKEDIKSARNKGNFSYNDGILERLYTIEDDIDDIGDKFNKLIDNMTKDTQFKFQNKQLELNEFENIIINELDNIKLFIDEKINDYQKDDSYDSNYNIFT